MAEQQATNQNLQNQMNQRSEELKPARQTTGAGETSRSGSSASSTNVDGRVDTDNRDEETFKDNTSKRNLGV